jgi:hypothetical protein
MNKTNFLKNYDLIIGIDAGKNTGFAVWNVHLKKFQLIETLLIHQAIFKIRDYVTAGWCIKVVVEDARKRQWFDDKKNSRAKLQGAGSIKRDSTIWEDYLVDAGLDYELVAPKHNVTKLSADAFKKWTKYEGKTNEHNRDAGMLVFQRTC